MRETWGFAISGELIFGNNATCRVGKVVRRLNGTQVLVVTDPVIRDAGLLERVIRPLEESLGRHWSLVCITYSAYDSSIRAKARLMLDVNTEGIDLNI